MTRIRNIMLGRPAERYRHEPGSVEVVDEDGNASLRRATADEAEYARRVIRRIEGDLDGPPPVRPWTGAPARSAAEIAECGVESVYQAPLVLAPPPFHMPASGSCCAGCRGVLDKRCCAYLNGNSS